MSRGRDDDVAGDPFGVGDEGGAAATFPTPVEVARFVAGALRRRWAIAVAVFLPIVGAACLYYRYKPPTYRVEARIVSQRPSAIVPGVGAGDDLPSRSAWDLVHRRENIEALIRNAGLLEGRGVDTSRPLAGRLLELLRPPEVVHQEEPLDVLVRILDRRLEVTAEGGAVEFKLDWSDAQVAYQIVQGAVQNFLEARHLQEVTSVDDVIAQLDGRTARLRADLEAAIASAAARRSAPGPRGAAPRPRLPSEEAVRLRSLLEAKARALRDVEEFRSRRLAELQSQLGQARATLSDRHPTVVALQRDEEVLNHDSPQLTALREEERAVRAQYTARLASEGLTSDAVGALVPQPAEAGAPREEDPQVRDLRLQYEQMNARVTSARVELDAARAAFKYRYEVVWPPRIPTEPYSPRPLVVLGGGFLLALLCGLLAAVLPELLSGRIVERWQVERVLGIPVVGETPPRR
jgi:uncharacterized protein involved in exopolysaccharide biosynthesis